MNNQEVRPTSNLIISTCSAYDYLNHSNPNLERLTTLYYETFSITDRFTGYFSNITIGDFFDNLAVDYCDSSAILGGLNATARKSLEESSSKSNSSGSGSSESSGSGSSSEQGSAQTANNPGTDEISEVPGIVIAPEDLTAGTSSIVGDRGTENLGLAVFKDDKLCGKLTATETICHLLISNNIDSFIITIDSPLENKEKIDLQLFPNKDTKVNLDIIDDKPYISINVSLNADIMTLTENVDYETKETLSKVSASAKEYLDKQFNNYLNKVSKEYNIDIDQFCKKAPAHFATISEFENFNWPEKYKNAEFNVEIDIKAIWGRFHFYLLTKR